MENVDSPSAIEKEIRELEEKQEELRRKATALKVKKNKLIRDSKYGDRAGVNLEIPILDDVKLEEEMARVIRKKYEVAHAAFKCFFSLSATERDRFFE